MHVRNAGINFNLYWFFFGIGKAKQYAAVLQKLYLCTQLYINAFRNV